MTSNQAPHHVMTYVCTCASRYLPIAGLSVSLALPALAQTDSSAPQAQTLAAAAESFSWWQGLRQDLVATWQSDQQEVLLPVHTWHNRHFYSEDRIREYNENPWGIGLGKYRYDGDGNWHSVFAMAFEDSHRNLEPYAGYGYMKEWRPGSQWRLGAGFTLGLTGRKEYDYVPIPLLLPLLSIQYRSVALESTYIPGARNSGNILFTWLRWQY
jgi:palmitoyl transferase